MALGNTANELEVIFGELAQTITRPGATNIVLNDYITDCFRILSVTAPTKGTATLVNERQLRWTISELDVSGSPERFCDARHFKVRFIANYIDAGFTCCTLDD